MSLTINPQDFFHRHRLGTSPNLTVQLEIQTDQEWFLTNDPSMIFKLNGANTAEISGTGNQTVEIKLTNDVNFYDEGVYEMKLRAFTLDEPDEKIFIIYLLVAEGMQNLILPKRLDFEAVRNVTAAPSQRVYVAVDSPVVNVTPPAWLEIESSQSIGNGHIFDIKPVDQSGTPNKNYNGVIKFYWPLGEQEQTIPTSYKIHAGYEESYTKDVHFTKDNDELVFYKTTPDNSFLKMDMEVKTANQSFSLILDFPFFNNVARINLGKEIESYFEARNFGIFTPGSVEGSYPPIEVRITAIEIRNEDFAILNQDILPLQYFLRGRNPSTQITRPFWADYRPEILRMISATGIVSISVFKPAKKHIEAIDMKRNGVRVETFDRFSHNFGVMRPYFATLFVNLRKFNFQPGDEVSFASGKIVAEKTFLITPNVKSSIMIAFKTDWNTFEMMEFRGSMRYETDYNHELFEVERNYTAITKKLNTENPQKVIINTGWIFQEETFVLDQLKRSVSAFLLPETEEGNILLGFADYKNTEIIPVSSKMVNFDSETNRYQYDVEFLINPEYENQIFSRELRT